MGTEGEMRSSWTADPQYEGGSTTTGMRCEHEVTSVSQRVRRKVKITKHRYDDLGPVGG